MFDDAVTFERIQTAVEESGLSELQSFVPAEIYRGEKVGKGKYSVLLHAEFQSQEHTLRDEEVAHVVGTDYFRFGMVGGVLRAK